MIIRSIAPLRLGLAGGGTDVSPYCDLYGGSVLNATINMFAYATILPTSDDMIKINSIDLKKTISIESGKELVYDGNLDLIKATYNRIVKEFKINSLSFELFTYVDAVPGSGLGSSSTLVVAVIGAFVEWLKLPLGEYDIAKLAFSIEREDLLLEGGKQDQYAATFGGVNFMEFGENNKVVVNPLRIKSDYLHELELNILLYNTGTSRLSHKIITAQQQNVKRNKTKSINAMHNLKEQSLLMKESLLMGNLNEIGRILNFGWENKKLMTKAITNSLIDKIYTESIKAGATGGKISGAGGGGYMLFFCPTIKSYRVKETLIKFGGTIQNFQFDKRGLRTWTIK